MTKIDKWSILAGVRFILASIVAINHLNDFTSLGCFGFVPMFGAFEAILGFLLISGYSISASYAKQPEGFLWRRIMRLYPIYLAAMAITYLAGILIKAPAPGAITLIENALFLNQLITHTSFVGPAWSLSLEFWLYCLTPALMLLSKAWIRSIVFISFISYVVYTVLRTVSHLPYYSGVEFGANLLFLSYIWVAGLLLTRSVGDEKALLRKIGVIFCCYIALDVAIQFGSRLKHHSVPDFFSHDVIGFVMRSATLVFVYLVFKHLVISERHSLHRSRFLRFLGDISYPLYLLHGALFVMLKHFGFASPALYYLIAVLVSAVVYLMVDFYSRKRHQQLGTGEVKEPTQRMKPKLAPETL